MRLDELDTMIRTVCPITGLMGDGRVLYADEATVEQKAAADAMMAANIGMVTNEPAPAPEPTKAELQAQLAALAAKIEAL
jgi:hypothetical protein